MYQKNIRELQKHLQNWATSLRNLRKSLTQFDHVSWVFCIILIYYHYWPPWVSSPLLRSLLQSFQVAAWMSTRRTDFDRFDVLNHLQESASGPQNNPRGPATESLRWTGRPTELKHWLSTMRNGGFLYMLLLYSSIHTNSEKHEAMDCEWFWFLRSHQFLNIFWICLDILKSARTCKGWYLWHHHINRSSVDAQRIPRINSCGEPMTNFRIHRTNLDMVGHFWR